MGMSEDLTGKREAEGNENSGKVYGVEPGREIMNKKWQDVKNYLRISLPMT